MFLSQQGLLLNLSQLNFLHIATLYMLQLKHIPKQEKAIWSFSELSDFYLSLNLSVLAWFRHADELISWNQHNCVNSSELLRSLSLVAVMRLLGIPCRVVTNFQSAHDRNQNLTIDVYHADYGVRERPTRDSVWWEATISSYENINSEVQANVNLNKKTLAQIGHWLDTNDLNLLYCSVLWILMGV